MIRALVLSLSLLWIPAAFGQTGWTDFSSPEGNFTVSFPGSPQQQTGSQRNLHVFTVRNGGEAYGLAYADYAPNSKWEDAINGERDSVIKGLGSKIVSEKQVSLGGHPGKAIVFASNDVVGELRIYFVGRRLYLLQALAPKGSEHPQNFTRYLDSFHLLKPAR